MRLISGTEGLLIILLLLSFIYKLVEVVCILWYRLFGCFVICNERGKKPPLLFSDERLASVTRLFGGSLLFLFLWLTCRIHHLESSFPFFQGISRASEWINVWPILPPTERCRVNIPIIFFSETLTSTYFFFESSGREADWMVWDEESLRSKLSAAAESSSCLSAAEGRSSVGIFSSILACLDTRPMN